MQDSPEELGYVSDVCDYNVNEKLSQPQPQSPGAPGVVHGKLSLSLASENKAIKVDKTRAVVRSENSAGPATTAA